MAGQKKFGAFAGVFTPSLLTILGVIMYMRLGWVVGNAGLIGAIIIIVIAHVIAVTTGLSVSSVATDKKIGAGGIYYVLSRSMGIPIGGSIGIALYIGTAFSIALYLIGFAESFNGYFGFGTSINDLRLTGTIALFSITALALISTSAALKAQFFILAAIIISLVSIFMGTKEYAPESVAMFSGEGSVSLEIVFAIFFPAVTGFTAGIAMSGDLKDPKRAIPSGTLWAIAVGLVVYITLAVFIANTVNADLLKNDYNILMKIAMFAPAVVAGIWGATLSSALGGILGGPRILQAMSTDKVTPKIFARGKGKNNEPVNALILVFVIAEIGILIGELDVIARIVSMFYLTAYGFINISFFLESWANPDFQPTFKVKRWIGLVGSIACFAVMFKLDMIAMFGAFAMVGLLYFWLSRKQFSVQTTDVWESVWSNVVNKGLKKLRSKENNQSNWNPNIIMFSSDSTQRPKMLEFSKTLSGRTGIVTDFKLINKEEGVNFSKTEQSYKDDLLDKLGIFGRKIEVDDPYSGIENIASTYGFSGIEPNSILMNWSRTTNDSEKFTKMTQKLIHLDYNLLYLDLDEKTEFGQQETIDLWWRDSDGNNAELMLNIARYLSQSNKWGNAKIRILYVNHNNTESDFITSKIEKLIEKLRVNAEIKIINNGVEQKSFYEIIELQSANTDLILLGIPNIQPEKQAQYILTTDHLFETVGTTLLVKASNKFNELDLNFVIKGSKKTTDNKNLTPLSSTSNEELFLAVTDFESQLSSTVKQLNKSAFAPVSKAYNAYTKKSGKRFSICIQAINKNRSVNNTINELQLFLSELINYSEEFKNKELNKLKLVFDNGMTSFIKNRADIISNTPKALHLKNGKIRHWKKLLSIYLDTDILTNTESVMHNFGVQNFIVLSSLATGIKKHVHLFVEHIEKNHAVSEESLNEFNSKINQLFAELNDVCISIEQKSANDLQQFERNLCNQLIDADYNKSTYKLLKRRKTKKVKDRIENIEIILEEYAGNWHNNQQLSHNQLNADITLSKSGLTTFSINGIIQSKIKRTCISSQKRDLTSLMDIVKYISDKNNNSTLSKSLTQKLGELAKNISTVDFNELIQNEESKLILTSGKAKKTIQLISSEAYNDFQLCQDENVKTIDVPLSSIQSYIVRENYLTPLQAAIEAIESSFNKNAEEIFNFSNLLKHILNEEGIDNTSEYFESSEEFSKTVETLITNLEKTERTFNFTLGIQIHNTLQALNARTIIESIDSYSSISSKTEKQSKLQKWISLSKHSISAKYNNIYSFVVKRKRDVDTIRFAEKNRQYLNNIELTNDFIGHLEFQSGIEENLSFYYKKLFTGSHFGILNEDYNKGELMSVMNAKQRIDKGISGAIMISGESSSGKSYFIESITSTLFNVEKVYISPNVVQNYNRSDLNIALQSIFNTSGSAREIIKKQKRKTIFIFDDLEQWWLKEPGSFEAINYLFELIEEFGGYHYFILSTNIYSYDLLRKLSSVNEYLLSTVIISPIRKEELKGILLDRHKTAGAEIWLNTNLVDETKKIDAIVNAIHSKSNGNIGVALNLWINSIQKNEEGLLYIGKPADIIFPEIDNPYWKIVLYHFVLHKYLTKIELETLLHQPQWLEKTLNELLKSSIVYQKTNGAYTLKESSIYFIELWLKEQKIIS